MKHLEYTILTTAGQGHMLHIVNKCERRENMAREPFKHLTMTDRLRIEKWQKQGMPVRVIAEKLRVHNTTIYRELRRGRYERLDGDTWEMKTAYSPDIAEAKYREHLRNKGPQLKIGNDHELAQYLEETIISRSCSPAAALGYAKLEGREFRTSLSIPTIYSYIRKGVFLHLRMEDCPRHGKLKHKYHHLKRASRPPAGDSIEQRPAAVASREEFGHWEMDTVYSGKQRSKASLLTMTERKTRKEIIIHMPDRKAATVIQAVDALERKYGAVRFRAIFKTITVDNGVEFSSVDELERSCIRKTIPRTKVFYAHPYSSWERGTNEINNAMIRRRFPKGTSFEKMSKREIEAVERWMNGYPRRILNYSTSDIAFANEVAAV